MKPSHIRQRGHGDYGFLLWILWAFFALSAGAWGFSGYWLFRWLAFLLKG